MQGHHFSSRCHANFLTLLLFHHLFHFVFSLVSSSWTLLATVSPSWHSAYSPLSFMHVFYACPSYSIIHHPYARRTIACRTSSFTTRRLHATFQRHTIVHCILSFTARTRDVPTTYHRLPASVGLAQARPNKYTSLAHLAEA